MDGYIDNGRLCTKLWNNQVVVLETQQNAREGRLRGHAVLSHPIGHDDAESQPT